MRREQGENELLEKEIEVLNGEEVSVLVGNEGVLCYRHGVIGPWEPYGDEDFRVALAINRGVLIRHDKSS